MTRFYPDSLLTFDLETRQGGTLVDCPELTFKYKFGDDGEINSLTPTRIDTGLYSTSFVPGESGDILWKWDTNGTLDIAKAGRINIAADGFA